MGCAQSTPSAQPDGPRDSQQANGATKAAESGREGTGTAAGAPALNKPLSNKTVFPGSFFEREAKFRREQAPRKAVPERKEGPCKLRGGSWGAWKEGWCSLEGHKLQFHEGAGAPPPPGAHMERSLELVGAHLRSDHKQEVVLAPAGGGQPVTLAFPCQEHRDEWMVGLAGVPGLFRRVRDYYDMGSCWGHGATCEVHECVARFSGRRLALKARLHKHSKEATQAMHNELRILQICAKHPHPAIPQLYDYFFDEDGSIELVMDLMQGGELFDHIAMAEQLQEDEARDIFKQVVDGVAHLHSLGIAHRDLKPQNLMYVSADEGGQVKVMDYDLAKVNYAPTWEGGTPCGTLHYMAPEIVQHQRYSLAVDCWSLGVILFILLTGHIPFDGKDSESIATAIEAGRYSLNTKLWVSVSDDAKDLVRGLLQTDPEQRLTAQQVLQHPWLTARLDNRPPVQLDSPGELRHTLSKTERGRQLLALAAMACSEGDLRQPRSAAATAKALAASKAANADRAALRRSGGASHSALDFDMQPVRDQASSPRAAGAARQNGGTEAPAVGEEGNDVARLRAQLRTIGTAAGLQDRQVMEAEGLPLEGASPRSTTEEPAARQVPAGGAGGAAPAWWPRLGEQGAQPPSREVPASDSFADLGALEVEEQDLPGSAARSRRSSFNFERQPMGLEDPEAGRAGADPTGSKGGGSLHGGTAFGSFLSPRPSPGPRRAATAAQEREQRLQQLRAPLQLHLPPVERLPGDQQLIEILAEQQDHSRHSTAGPAAFQRTGLHRASTAVANVYQKSAVGAAGGGSGGGAGAAALKRASSSSRLNLKNFRLEEAEREPVDLAMQLKRERLRRLSCAVGL